MWRHAPSSPRTSTTRRGISERSGNRRHDQARRNAWQATDRNQQRDIGGFRPFEMLGARIEGRTKNDAAGSMLAHQSHHLILTPNAFRGVRHERNVARHLQHLFDADCEFSKEGIRKVVENETNDTGLRVAQVGGPAVVDVTETPHGLQDMLTGLGLDTTAPGQDERNR